MAREEGRKWKREEGAKSGSRVFRDADLGISSFQLLVILSECR